MTKAIGTNGLEFVKQRTPRRDENQEETVRTRQQSKFKMTDQQVLISNYIINNQYEDNIF
jgi:hypothetical protein